MIKVKDKIKINADLEKIKKESLYELSKDPDIKNFLQINHIDYQTMSKYWSVFLNYYEDKKLCSHCQGLDYCPKISKGLCETLHYDGMVTTTLSFCRYGKIKEKDHTILTKFVFNNLSDKIALTKLEETVLWKKGLQEDKDSLIKLKKILDYLDHPVTHGFYFYDENSSHATLIGASLMNALAGKGYKTGICNFPTLLYDMKTSFSQTSTESYLKQILDIPYLLIDGLGDENVGGWSRDEILLTLLNYRAINELPTFFTSSFSIDELQNVYTIRLRDKTDQMRARKIAGKVIGMSDEIILD